MKNSNRPQFTAYYESSINKEGSHVTLYVTYHAFKPVEMMRVSEFLSTDLSTEESDYDKILYPIKDKHDLMVYPHQHYSAQNDGTVKIEFTICLFLHDAENTEKILNTEVTGKLLCDIYEKLIGWSRYSNEVMLSNLLEGKWN